jgi:hypothetical protein
MKSLIVLGLAVASSGAIANSDVTTIEGGVGRFEIIQQENFAPTTGSLFSTNNDVSSGYIELGSSLPLSSFIDVYGMVGATSKESLNTSTVMLEDTVKNYSTRYDTKISGKQIYLATGLDIHTPQQEVGLSAGARIGVSVYQQNLSFQQVLVSSTDPALKDQVAKIQQQKDNPLNFAPVYGLYLQYQFNRNDSVRLAVSTSTIDFDTDDVLLQNPVKANIEQEIRTVGLLFTHRY